MVDMVDVRMLGFDVYHIKPSICGMDNPWKSRLPNQGSAPLAQDGGEFVRLESLDLQKYAQRPAIAKALCDYMCLVRSFRWPLQSITHETMYNTVYQL